MLFVELYVSHVMLAQRSIRKKDGVLGPKSEVAFSHVLLRNDYDFVCMGLPWIGATK